MQEIKLERTAKVIFCRRSLFFRKEFRSYSTKVTFDKYQLEMTKTDFVKKKKKSPKMVQSD